MHYFYAIIQQKKDQDEREAAERAKAEEAARQSAEQAKKEYQVQLAQEVRLLYYVAVCSLIFFQLLLLRT